MALKKNEQLLIDSILQTAKIVQGIVGNDISMINEKLEEMLAGFYQETQKKLILSVDDDGKVSYRVADYKSDFVRTRTNTEKTLLSLKGKINSVPIDVKVAKDDVEFTNAEVAEALKELASIVAKMPEEMTLRGHADWPRDIQAISDEVKPEVTEVTDLVPDTDDIEGDDDHTDTEAEQTLIEKPRATRRHVASFNSPSEE
jgi:hypothetical protein